MIHIHITLSLFQISIYKLLRSSNRPDSFPHPLANKGIDYAQFFFSKISAYDIRLVWVNFRDLLPDFHNVVWNRYRCALLRSCSVHLICRYIILTHESVFHTLILLFLCDVHFLKPRAVFSGGMLLYHHRYKKMYTLKS